MRGFFGRGVYNEVETESGGGEGVQEQEMIAQLLQQDERGMEALLQHYGPLMRYIIARQSCRTHRTGRSACRRRRCACGTRSRSLTPRAGAGMRG